MWCCYSAVPVEGKNNLNAPPVVAGVPALRVSSQKEQAPPMPSGLKSQNVDRQLATKKITEAAKPIVGAKPTDVALKPQANIPPAGLENKAQAPKNILTNNKQENKQPGVILDAMRKQVKV